MTDKVKGVSSDCTLPPEIIIGLQLSGECPCDRCNENREICRGYPRKGFEAKSRKIEYIGIQVSPAYETNEAIAFRIDMNICGERFGLNQIYPTNHLNSYFDRFWEDMGRKLKITIENHFETK